MDFIDIVGKLLQLVYMGAMGAFYADRRMDLVFFTFLLIFAQLSLSGSPLELLFFCKGSMTTWADQ